MREEKNVKKIEMTENNTRKVPLGMILDKMIEQNGFISEDLKDALIMADKAGIGTEDSPLPDYQWILTDDRKLTYKAPISAEADLVLLLRAKSGDQDAQATLINVWSDFTYKTVKSKYPQVLADGEDECKAIADYCLLIAIKNHPIVDINGQDVYIKRTVNQFDFVVKHYMFGDYTDNAKYVSSANSIAIDVHWIKDLYKIKKFCLENNITKVNNNDFLYILSEFKKKKIFLTINRGNIHTYNMINNYITLINSGFETSTTTVYNDNTDDDDNSFWDLQRSEKSVEDQITDLEILQPILDAYKDNQKIQIFYDLYANELSFKEVMEKYNCKKSTIDSAIRVAKRIIVHELQKDPETYAILQRDYSGKTDIDDNDEATA